MVSLSHKSTGTQHLDVVFVNIEPTTGVDSTSAQAIVETARQLAVDRSVVVTIHQPSAELFGTVLDSTYMSFVSSFLLCWA